jgi:hypothetical protein
MGKSVRLQNTERLHRERAGKGEKRPVEANCAEPGQEPKVQKLDTVQGMRHPAGAPPQHQNVIQQWRQRDQRDQQQWTQQWRQHQEQDKRAQQAQQEQQAQQAQQHAQHQQVQEQSMPQEVQRPAGALLEPSALTRPAGPLQDQATQEAPVDSRRTQGAAQGRTPVRQVPAQEQPSDEEDKSPAKKPRK